MKKYFFIALAALLWVSCSQTEPMAVDDQAGTSVDKHVKTGIHAISEEMAIEIANENMACLDPATRSNEKRVKSVQKFLNRANAVKTRATNTVEVGYYLINYENEGGFAVVADDDRVRPLHAISDTGSLHMSDTINNKGLAQFFSSLLPAVDTTIVVGPIKPWIDPVNPPIKPTISKVLVKPILTEFVRKWHQDYPFNKYCDNNAVCCVALSCGMVMSAFEWPSSYNTYSFNWADIKTNHYNDGLAHLLRELGRPQNLNVNYGYDASSAIFDDCLRTFVNLGYQQPKIGSFSLGTVIDYLEKGQPVLIDGRVVGNYYYGHAWVLDGLYMVEGNLGAVVQPGDDTYIKQYFLHCVWGAGGSANGYYSFYGSSVGDHPFYSGEGDDTHGLSIQFSNWRIIYDFKKK